MNKAKLLICTFVGLMALTACDKEDNPAETPVFVNVDEPQEEVTDQPAFSRVN